CLVLRHIGRWSLRESSHANKKSCKKFLVPQSQCAYASQLYADTSLTRLVPHWQPAAKGGRLGDGCSTAAQAALRCNILTVRMMRISCTVGVQGPNGDFRAKQVPDRGRRSPSRRLSGLPP